MNLIKHQWILDAQQIVEGVMFLHQTGILHNDIKPDNVILRGWNLCQVTIIDFGKARCKCKAIIYNLSKEQSHKYNENHRHLAHELRNNCNCKQNELTDTYSVGYILKHVGYYENFNFLYNTGRKLKDVSISNRMKLIEAHSLFGTFLSNFTFI